MSFQTQGLQRESPPLNPTQDTPRPKPRLPKGHCVRSAGALAKMHVQIPELPGVSETLHF